MTRVEGDGTRDPVSAAHLPVTVDLRTGGGLAVAGPRERALGVLARCSPSWPHCTPRERWTCSC